MTLAPLQKTRLGTGLFFSLGSICSLVAILATTGGYFYVWILFALACIVWATVYKKGILLVLCCIIWSATWTLASINQKSHYDTLRSDFLMFTGSTNSFTGTVEQIRSDRNDKLRTRLSFTHNSQQYTVEGVWNSWLPIHPGDQLILRHIQLWYESSSGYLISQWLLASITGEIEHIVPSRTPSIFTIQKDTLNRTLSRGLPPNEAGLVAGMLYGEKWLMNDTLAKAYQTAGLSHLVVVSGSNIALVLIVLLTCTRILERRIRVPLLVAGTVLYILFVWADAPVIRAGIMGLIGYLFVEYGNRVDSLRTLLFATVILSLTNTYSLLYDAGFQLSILATLGLICASPTVTQFLKILHIPRFFHEIIGTSIAASIFTFPIILWVFGTTHLMSIFANIAIAPFVGLSMLWWVSAIIGEYIGGSIGFAIGFIGYWPIWLCNTIALTFANLPWKISIPTGEWRIWIWMITGIINLCWMLYYLVSRIPPKEFAWAVSQPDRG